MRRRALGVACGAHALHDGYTDLIYVMLPIWQNEFGLGFAALGLMKTVFSGTLAVFRFPQAFWPNATARPIVLALGTALAGLGYCLAGFSSGVATLVAALFVAGLGASTQHPLASALIAHAFAGAALAEGARHLQFRRRHRQDDGAGGGVAAVRRAALARGAGVARRLSA